MKIFASIFLAFMLSGAVPAPAQSHKLGKLWKVSAAVLAASSVEDAQSSWGKYELNPLLRGSSGAFGPKAVSLKALMMSGTILGQWMLLHKQPRFEKLLDFTNFGIAGVFTYTAIHNQSVPKMQ